jgi:hypothetical protein
MLNDALKLLVQDLSCSEALTKKEEFQELINSISKKHIQSKDTKDNFYIDSEDILHIFKNLNEQIDGQSEIIHGCSKQLEIFQDALTILTRELVKKGHLQIREKRNFLLRNENTLEALITLLNRKKLISRRELLIELKKKRNEHHNMKQDTTSTDDG